MAKINYLKGDAVEPQHKPSLIIHVCNDIHAWGSGFVVALTKKWPHVEDAYRKWEKDFRLGQIQIVKAEKGIAVANMIGQSGCGGFHHFRPIRYECLDECLYRVSLWLTSMQKKMNEKIVVAGPRFGAGLAGGDWKKIEPLIEKNICLAGFDVDIYDFQ